MWGYDSNSGGGMSEDRERSMRLKLVIEQVLEENKELLERLEND